MQDFHFYVVIADVVLSKKLLFCLYEMVSDDAGLCTTRSCFLVTPEFFISRPYLGKCARRGKQGLDRSPEQTQGKIIHLLLSNGLSHLILLLDIKPACQGDFLDIYDMSCFWICEFQFYAVLARPSNTTINDSITTLLFIVTTVLQQYMIVMIFKIKANNFGKKIGIFFGKN